MPMQNKFRKLIFTLFILAFISGCVKKPSEKDIEKSLTNTMNKFLNTNTRVDSSKSKFDVLDVVYFEDEALYHCEFKVHLISPTKDTTGVMTATISKDFERVHRKS